MFSDIRNRSASGVEHLQSTGAVAHVYAQPHTPEFLSAKESVPRGRPWFAVRHLEAVRHFENGLETVGREELWDFEPSRLRSVWSRAINGTTSYFAGK